MFRTHTLGQLDKNLVGEKVTLAGWVNSRRDHGGLIFIDLRDREGMVQIVFNPQQGSPSTSSGDPSLRQAQGKLSSGANQGSSSLDGGEPPTSSPPSKRGEIEGGLADSLRAEWVVQIKGEIKARPAGMENPHLSSGEIEVVAENLVVLSQAQTLPFDVTSEGKEINEEIRLKYRYLDLRRPRLRNNLILRHRVIKYIRDFLTERGFIEVETPILTKATPEGARDFIVPSRLKPGKFYALPQSPQQYKQLLMVAGLERYFQIPRCFRDEDPRADRLYGEFTQLDLEMSFVTQNEILELIEELFIKVTEEVVNKKIYQKPFPRFSHKEAMEKFGDDKFDLRKDKDPNICAFAWVLDFPLFEQTETKEINPSHHPFTAPKDEDLKLLETNNLDDLLKIHSKQHDLVCNGYEVAGGSIRITDPRVQSRIFQILGYSDKEIQRKFGHLLKAFEYGVPPHGGIAPGIDRLLTIWAGEQSVREVVAFPMSGGGETAVMEAPSEVDEKQLKEAHINVI